MHDITEVDALTGKTTYSNFTAEEVTQREVDLKAYKAQIKKQEAETQAKLDARETALSKLSALGLTPEEIAAL